MTAVPSPVPPEPGARDTAALRADPRLGTVPDTALAREYGVTRQYVSDVRSRLGIARHRLPIAAPPPRDVVPEVTRRRLIVAIALCGRTWKDVAAGCRDAAGKGWSLPALRRKLAPADAPEDHRRALTAADVARIAAALGTTPAAIEATPFAPGDEAVLADLRDEARPRGDLAARFGGPAIARLLHLGLVTVDGDTVALTPPGRRAAVP